MKALKAISTLLGTAILGGGLFAPGALAAPSPAPAWSAQAFAAPTNFKPADASGTATYEAFFTNSGGKPTDQSQITIVDTLPPGVGVKSIELKPPRSSNTELGPAGCESEAVGEVSTVTCEVTNSLAPKLEPAKLYPGDELRLAIHVTVPPLGPSETSRALINHAEVQGGGAVGSASAESHNQISPVEDVGAGFQEFHFELTGAGGLPTTGADSHPYQAATSFAVNLNPAPPGTSKGLPFVPAGGDLKEIEVKLPPGFIGNPTAIPRCTAQQFNTIHGVADEEGITFLPNECPDDSAVGLFIEQQAEGSGTIVKAPIYNLIPPKGMPAQLGFRIGAPIYINTRLRSDGDYGITAYLHNVTEAKRITAARVMIWGTPGEESHDTQRGFCAELGGICKFESEAARPFLRLPSSCVDPLRSSFGFDTWLNPGTIIAASFAESAPTDCNLPDFSPTITSKPTTNVADAPSGLDFNLHLPQAANEDPEGLAEADIREAKVTLPEGFLLNPSSADGLDGCSAEEIGLTSSLGQLPARFSADSPSCPNASKLGSVQVDTPLVDHPLPGAVYLANPHQNPFNSLIAIYITVDDPQTGVVVKLAGHVEADPLTGQLITTVQESPQTPFEDFKLEFFEGARAPLRTPAICGTHTTTTSLKPWTSPASGPNATPSDSFQITQALGGGSCPTSASGQPNSPSFEAGTAAPVAGAYSPFSLRLARADGSQEINGLDLTLPPGLTGRLAGLSYCSDGALASATSKSGRSEQGSPSCPGTSELGTVTVAAGAGPAPYHAQGKAYLAGPYKGAPISMAVVTPAVAGPFDLGTVVVRAALHVDPETARIKAASDPLPTILQGIPLDVRSIDLDISRDQFTLNPTSCEPFAFSGVALSTLNQAAMLNSRFQVGGCKELSFKPKLSLRLKGGTRRGDNPALTATLKMPPGGANIAKVQVALPRSEFLDQAHIRTICTRVQFAAKACPKGAIYGFAKAWTPLLDQPLQGPVYLRSSDNKLPDLIADLNGQIQVVLHGRTDSIRGGIRNTFEGVPDAPASKFVLSLKGGKRGLLINSRDICKGKNRARATFTSQSGKVAQLRPPIEARCRGKGGVRKQGGGSK
jgi:hypothetical protein